MREAYLRARVACLRCGISVVLCCFLALELSLKYAVFHGALRLHDFEVGVMARIYQPLMTFGPRKLKPKFCSIVRLNSYRSEAGLWQTRDQRSEEHTSE